MAVGIGLVGCAGEPAATDDTDIAPDLSACLETEDGFSMTLLGEGVIEGANASRPGPRGGRWTC